MTYLTDDIANADPVELYEFTFGAQIWRFTDADANYVSAGNTYTPEPISRSNIRQSDEDGSMSVDVIVDALNPIADFFRVPFLPAQQLWLTIYRTHIVALPNIVPWSRGPFLGANGWSVPAGGVGSSVMNRPGIDGVANGGATVSDTDAASIAQLFRQIPITPDFNWRTFTYWVDKDADVSRQPRLHASLLGGTYITRAVDLNTVTGAAVSSGVAGTTRVNLSPSGLHWIVEITIQNDGTRTAAQPTVYAAGASTAATGSMGIGFIGVELGLVSSFQTVATAYPTNATPATSTEIATLFRGRVGQCIFEGGTAKLTAVPMRNAIQKSIPVQLVQRLCNNTLYDQRCKADPNTFKFAGTITSLVGLTITVTGAAAARPTGYFDGGFIQKAGTPAATILDHTSTGAIATIRLLYNPGYSNADVIDLFAGCDKRYPTCRDKFANVINHQGYPQFPTFDPFQDDMI